MDLTINLPTATFDRLRAEADARGATVEVIAAEVLDSRFGRRRHLSFAAAGSSTTGRGAAEAEALLTEEGFGDDSSS